MDKEVSRRSLEYLIRQRFDDSMLDRFMARLPLEDVDSRLKKALLLLRIHTEVSTGIVTEKILDLLELVGELDFSEGKSPSENMRAAYCSVAVDCTVCVLELDDNRMYFETLQRIWRDRVQKMANSENSGLITEKLWSWRDDLEAASSDAELRDKILSTNTRHAAFKAIKGYLAESWNEMGPSFMEKTAEEVYCTGKCPSYIDETAEDVYNKDEGPSLLGENAENVYNKGKGPSSLEKTAEDVYNKGKGPSLLEKSAEDVYNKGKDSSLLEKTAKDVHNKGKGPSSLEKTAADVSNMGKAGQEVNEFGEEQGFEGLENIIDSHDGITPSDGPSAAPHNQGSPPRPTHPGVHKKPLNGKCSKVKIFSSEEVDKDTNMNAYRCYHRIPEVNKIKRDLKSSFEDLNPAVKDPSPEALKVAEDVLTDVQRDTCVSGNHGGNMNVDSMPMDITDCLGNSSVENIKGNGHLERDEYGNENQSSAGDPFELSEELPPTQPHLSSPSKTRLSPLKKNQFAKLERRRVPRKWSLLEEDTLRKGVKQFGRGNWKAILMEYPDIFEERKAVDLKDKWRNMTRYSR